MTDLAAALRPHVGTGGVPGLVALVGNQHAVEVVAWGSQGTSGTPMRRESILRAASLTKPLIAALTMMLVEDKRLDLDGSVDVFLPELAAPRVLRTPGSQLEGS